MGAGGRRGLPVLVGVVLAACAHADPDLDRAAADPAHWAMPGGDAANHRYSPLDRIHRGNVGRLQVAWSFATGVQPGHEGNPLVVDDRMYLHTPYPNRVFAVDLDTRRVVWKYTPRQSARAMVRVCCETVNRGLAYGDGKILLQQADTTLVALDARTGRPVWSVVNGDPARGAVNSNAPQVFGDKVITGISGGASGVRGYLSAYDLRTGRLAWRAYSTGPDADVRIDPARTTTWADGRVQVVGRDSSLASWQGDQWQRGGGTTWGWYSHDPALGLLYYGTSSPGTFNARQRPGANRWTTSLWARDLATGTARWVFQLIPHDEWNFGAINEMILADIPVDGRAVRALVHFDRNGFAYTLDRATGALLKAARYDTDVNWATGIDPASGQPQRAERYSTERNGPGVVTRGVCPSALGAKNQQPAAFDRASGLFVVPVAHLCMDYEPFAVTYQPGEPYVGGRLSMYVPEGRTEGGGVLLWDAGRGRVVQARGETLPVWSGVLVTAGGIACYGTLDGHLACVDARDPRRELARLPLPSGAIGNVFTYLHKGRQYLGVFSGASGWIGSGLTWGPEREGAPPPRALRDGIAAPDAGGRLTLFALPE